ncbi:MAG: SLC13 family permease [Nitrosopumilus sp.]|uniref:SLC13 family permease n=1 Tax=Nitrosopumilus sp. TaxID=2024843 RepID=UPI00292D2F35|nr:SLC13 family permease [Nitrosopumilus sp.]
MIPKHILYPVILGCISITVSFAGLNPEQIASVTIFASLIVGTLLFWRFRLAFALVGIAAMLGLGLLNTDTMIEFAGFDMILFLVGMMIVVGFLEEKKFFEHLLGKIMKGVGNNPIKLVVILMLMSALFAALVDEVTSILFMTATVLHLTGKLRISAIPLVMMTVFATNIGSSATVVGNPVGVLIAMRADLTFMEFLRWATPISIAGLGVAIPLSLLYFRKYISQMGDALRSQKSEDVLVENSTLTASSSSSSEVEVSLQKENFKIPWIIFIGTIAALVAHSPMEESLGLEKNVLLPGVAFAAAGIVLFLNHSKAREMVEKRVDWWTLAFFIFLFASVGTMKMLGVTTVLAEGMYDLSGNDETNLYFLFVPVTSILSALMDNVLAVATFIPVVHEFGDMGVDNYPFWWGMLFSGTFFGNLTLIGSTANIVAIGMLERRKRGNITLKEWIKPGAVISVPTMILAAMLVFLQIPMMPS